MRDDGKTLIHHGKVLLASLLTACMAELLIFNLSSLKTAGARPVTLAAEADTDESGIYETEVNKPDDYIRNVYVEGLTLINAEYAKVSIYLTDEGDEYEYELPVSRIVPEIKGSGYINIYPYGRVHGIRVRITVSEGAQAHIGSIVADARRPFNIRPIRMLAVLLAALLLILTFTEGFTVICERDNRRQIVCTILICCLIVAAGRWLSLSNPLMVACPWPHHKQYQELAVSLSEGTVRLDHLSVAPELLMKDNPYDTIALLAEGIPYNMDYAYYDGAYYVYFGIIPELLLYYPYYILTGRQLSNYNADLVFYILLVAGVFLCIRGLIFKYAHRREDENKSDVPFALYILMCVCVCFLSNTVYLISRPDIYNIPIIAACAFTYMGTGLWLHATLSYGGKRTVLLALGSLCMAAVAGCRPQMLIFSLAAIPILLIGDRRASDSADMPARRIFTRKTVRDTVAFILPYIIMAIPVCIYNYARFGNIADFGATYSLTTNDMNHRGFNVSRLLRGLYCFFLQPPVITTDFPFVRSSVIDSSYMGKNLTEYTYGGTFVTNLLFGVISVPIFTGLKRLKAHGREAVLLMGTMLAGVLVIAAFDVNGAGILYRYTCDYIPGLVIAAYTLWILYISDREGVRGVSMRVFTLLALAGLFYSLAVLTGTEGSVNLMDNSPALYESIRQYFMW